ncbi:hypothetical protein AVEN_117346-1 [Araneus ventricosus]|uniref:Uncharacterized protein n=1 Tax=Araneus ventricosus TaxID=182803 RepID=A0A4Y2I0D0_ARAVE|nr:hypothetical protein AVEN_117346-1 [Araneus ventricosus]
MTATNRNTDKNHSESNSKSEVLQNIKGVAKRKGGELLKAAQRRYFNIPQCTILNHVNLPLSFFAPFFHPSFLSFDREGRRSVDGSPINEGQCLLSFQGDLRPQESVAMLCASNAVAEEKKRGRRALPLASLFRCVIVFVEIKSN